MEKHDPQKAIPYFQRALAHSDVRPTLRAELARAYRESGQMEAFSNEMRRVAAEGFPQLASFDGLCVFYLGLWEGGHGRRAWTFFQHALAENPDSVPMLNNVAWYLATDPPVGAERCEALRLAQRAHELSGDGLPALLDTLAAAYAADHGVKVGIEMHPGQLLYNVETFLRMRAEAGPALGANFDPSHLFWNGVDPVAAIRKLGDAIVHVHGKDCYVDTYNVAVNGCNDHKPYTRIPERAWTFRSIGYGHDTKTWKDIISAMRMVGYDYVVSIEHEDGMLSSDEGLAKGLSVLKEAVVLEKPGAMYWA